MDFADARKRMVDGQLRPTRVTDPRVLAAMKELPRERFLPPQLASRAYLDEDIPLPGGRRALIEPVILARMVQMLAVREGERALVVAAGTGYGAAVLARCGAQVVALEEEPELVAIARAALTETLPATVPVRVLTGSVVAGHAAGAPYDAILIEGQVAEIPRAISDQLAEGGRLAAVLGAAPTGRAPRAVLGRRIAGTFSVSDAFDCATVTLPEFQPAPGFVF